MHVRWGNSWRLTESGAAVGLAQLPTLDEDCAWRCEMIRRYQRGLADVPILTFPALSEESRPSGYKCIVRAPSRAHRLSLEGGLRDMGIQLARGVYEFPLHKHPVFAERLGDGTRRFPVADAFADEHLCLPLWRSIPESSIEGAIARIRRVASTL